MYIYTLNTIASSHTNAEASASLIDLFLHVQIYRHLKVMSLKLFHSRSYV